MNEPYADFAEATRGVLAFLQEQVPLGLWMVTRTDGQRWIVLQSADRGYGIKPGDVLPYAESLCAQRLACTAPDIAPDVAGQRTYGRGDTGVGKPASDPPQAKGDRRRNDEEDDEKAHHGHVPDTGPTPRHDAARGPMIRKKHCENQAVGEFRLRQRGRSVELTTPRLSIGRTRVAYLGPSLDLAPHRSAAAIPALALHTPSRLGLGRARVAEDAPVKHIAMIPPGTWPPLVATGPIEPCDPVGAQNARQRPQADQGYKEQHDGGQGRGHGHGLWSGRGQRARPHDHRLPRTCCVAVGKGDPRPAAHHPTGSTGNSVISRNTNIVFIDLMPGRRRMRCIANSP